MFGTVMNYCALRILGIPREHPDAARARAFIAKHGITPFLCSLPGLFSLLLPLL